MRMRVLVLVACGAIASVRAVAPAELPDIVPTFANVPYGPDPRQVLDCWLAPSSDPTPVVFYVHGGGWTAGDKRDICSKPALGMDVGRFLAAGISVVSVNYRLVTDALLAHAYPPVEWPMGDAARALQFVRAHRREWKLDATRIAGSGASAGGCTILWLALHDDLADPRSRDAVARESTRLCAVAVLNAQTSLDPGQMKAWTPNSVYGGHAFGFMADPRDVKTRDAQFPLFLAARERLLPAIRRYSPYEHVTPDDPPIYLAYQFGAPAIGQPQEEPTHTANFGVMLAETLREQGVPCELTYPGGAPVPHKSMQDFLEHVLRAKR